MKIINLSGRIDSNNAGTLESEISSQLAENPGETPAFDADTLAAAVSKHPERLEELSAKAANLLRKLHENFMGLPAQTIGAMWDIITQKYFGTSDKGILSRYSETMSLYSSLFIMYLMTFISDDERREKIAGVMARVRGSSVTLKTIEGI